MCQHCVKIFPYAIPLILKFYVGDIITPILQMRKLKLKESKSLTPSNVDTWILTQPILDPKLMFFPPHHTASSPQETTKVKVRRKKDPAKTDKQQS